MILLTYFAGGFRIEVAEQHIKIATHYGCRWEKRTLTTCEDVEKDKWSRPMLQHCLGDKRCYCGVSLLLANQVSKDLASRVSAHSKRTSKGHLAIAFDFDTFCCLVCLPLLILEYCDASEPSNVVLDKDASMGSFRALICPPCAIFRYDPLIVTKETSETKYISSWETTVMASPPALQMGSLSDQFILECRLIFTETVRLLTL